MIILSPKDQEIFEKNLSRMWLQQSWLWPHYSASARKYNHEMFKERGRIWDASFLMLWESRPVIALLGVVTEDDSTSDVPCISFEDRENLTTKAAKTFLKEFDRITAQLNGRLWYRDFLINGELSIVSRYLLAKGAKPVPRFSQVIDLGNDEARIKSQIRKSYGSLINWGLRELQQQVCDSTNLTWDQMNAFRQLHIREAGRETRSENSWRRQLEMIQAGEAFVVLGHFNEEMVSAGFFSMSRTNCYYQVSASRRDLFEKPLFHSLMWTAILHAKQLGCRWFEVGEQLYPNHPWDPPPSKKELGISEFKAGFGGQTRIFLDLKLDYSGGGQVHA